MCTYMLAFMHGFVYVCTSHSTFSNHKMIHNTLYLSVFNMTSIKDFLTKHEGLFKKYQSQKFIFLRTADHYVVRKTLSMAAYQLIW
jgi:hypothetical protein